MVIAPHLGFGRSEIEQRQLAGQCLRKVRHETRAAANIAVRVMGSRAKGTKPYRCPHCDGWHIGHPNPFHHSDRTGR